MPQPRRRRQSLRRDGTSGTSPARQVCPKRGAGRAVRAAPDDGARSTRATTGARRRRAVRSSRAPRRAAPPASDCRRPRQRPPGTRPPRPRASRAGGRSRVPARKSGAQHISTRVRLSPVCWCASSWASATSSSSPLSSRRAGEPMRMRGRTMPASAMPGRSGTSVMQKRPCLTSRPVSRTSRADRCQVAASLDRPIEGPGRCRTCRR